MHMVRFDNAGRQVWERQVTNLTGSRTGYDNGARFIWWYQHHGRLASDGNTYAAYFGVAVTVQNGSCVDIHEGDRIQVVDANGALVSGRRDSFEVGCSHSWTTRIVWDPRASRYAMVCATDNDCRIAHRAPAPLLHDRLRRLRRYPLRRRPRARRLGRLLDRLEPGRAGAP